MKDWVTIYSNRTSPSLAPVSLESRDAEAAGVLLHPSAARTQVDTIEDACYEEDDAARDRSRRLLGRSEHLSSRTS
jgi:hypothetical protein